AEDGIRDFHVTGVQTCALPILLDARAREAETNKAFQIAYGQTMGAIVSYCAFFKTTVDKIDLRTLQNELLTFRSRLLPAQDVSFKDQNFMSLQRMYLDRKSTRLNSSHVKISYAVF